MGGRNPRQADDQGVTGERALRQACTHPGKPLKVRPARPQHLQKVALQAHGSGCLSPPPTEGVTLLMPPLFLLGSLADSFERCDEIYGPFCCRRNRLCEPLWRCPFWG